MLGLGLENKTVIVTGAARGIGQHYCLGFAQAGANVMAADIIDVEDTLQKLLLLVVRRKASKWM